MLTREQFSKRIIGLKLQLPKRYHESIVELLETDATLRAKLEAVEALLKSTQDAQLADALALHNLQQQLTASQERVRKLEGQRNSTWLRFTLTESHDDFLVSLDTTLLEHFERGEQITALTTRLAQMEEALRAGVNHVAEQCRCFQPPYDACQWLVKAQHALTPLAALDDKHGQQCDDMEGT